MNRSRPSPARKISGVTAVVGAVALVLAACGPGSSPRGPASSHGTSPSTSPGALPAVDAAAFAGQGRLAFVWSGDLHVLDGAARSLRRIETRGATSPTWSADGRWLAFVAPAEGAPHAQQSEGAKQAWVVKADDTKPTAVPGLPPHVVEIAWSPAGERLAALASESPDAAPHLWVVQPGTPGRPAKQIVDADVFSFAWRPDGEALAYASTPPFSGDKPGTDTLHVVPVDGGPASNEITAPGDGITVAGWWPDGRGILWWRDPLHSASLAADGLELFSLTIGSHTPRRLTTTLTYRDWISWPPHGGRALMVAGSSRTLSETKTLQTCDVAAASCTALPDAPDGVSIDPAWSPRGDRIAFVRADEAAGGPSDWAAWVQTRTLWIAAPDERSARPVPSAGKAVFSPMWDRQGRRLLVVDDRGMELVDPEGRATTIVRRFPGPSGDVVKSSTGFFYGHLPVEDLIAWWRG